MDAAGVAPLRVPRAGRGATLRRRSRTSASRPGWRTSCERAFRSPPPAAGPCSTNGYPRTAPRLLQSRSASGRKVAGRGLGRASPQREQRSECEPPAMRLRAPVALALSVRRSGLRVRSFVLALLTDATLQRVDRFLLRPAAHGDPF